MPVRPQELASALPDYVIDDRPCVSCGYNLKGLRTRDNCPECGRPISRRRRGQRGSESLVQAPIGWLQAFKYAAVLLMISSAAFVLLNAFSRLLIPHLPAVHSIGLLTASVGWWVGVLLVTRPRPVMASTTMDPRREWFFTRLAARLTQACWPVAVGASLLAAQMHAAAVAAGPGAPGAAGPPLWLLFLASGAALVAALGLITLCIYISNICFWAADTGLAMNFRACAWSLTAAGTVGFLLSTHAIFSLQGVKLPPALEAFILGPVLLLGGLFILLAVAHLLWCLWRLQSMAAWAVIHHVTSEHREERMKERADRMAAAHRAEMRARR